MKILFVVSEDWYFCSHRLPLAEEALTRGWEVCLISCISNHAEELRSKGIRLFHVDLERGNLNPLKDFKYCRDLIKIYRVECPDIIHHVAMKPCLYGSIAAKLSRTRCYVNAVAGFGTLFSSSSIVIKIIRPLVLMAFRKLFSYKNCKLILQNLDDVHTFEHELKLKSDQISLIRGSGVDLQKFHPAKNKATAKHPLIVMVSRLLTDKGVLELIEAAEYLKNQNIDCQIALVGDVDAKNAHAVSDNVLKEAKGSGVVEFRGRRTDISDIYRDADIAVLPSYREGLPKSLIEAAACGLPIVTTDVPGCREVVDDGINGILIPAKQSKPLANALQKLIEDRELRLSMGIMSRKKAVTEFGNDQVIDKTFYIYDQLLKENRRC